MRVSQTISCLLVLVWSVVVTSQNASTQNQILNPPVQAEGGPILLPSNDRTHSGREHVLMESSHNNVGDSHMIKVNHIHRPDGTTMLPAYEVGQKNDNKTSVPKKDATLSENVISRSSTITQNTTTVTTATTKTKNAVMITTSATTTTRPHKPTVTIGEDEELLNSTKTKIIYNHGLSIESLMNKSKRTDYVVPIVAVILSVPIVAIVFSVLYKRGSDWWQHRHYRRMDFLIEGMYNN